MCALCPADPPQAFQSCPLPRRSRFQLQRAGPFLNFAPPSQLLSCRFSSRLIFFPLQTDFLAELSVRHALLPIHLSKSFMFATVPSPLVTLGMLKLFLFQTLPNALQLLLLRFLNRQYIEAFRVTESCVSDTDMVGGAF